MKKLLPIGVDNDKEMIGKSYYYVDKTLLMKEILDKRGKINLFTRPRRFGKTLALGMLPQFCIRKRIFHESVLRTSSGLHYITFSTLTELFPYHFGCGIGF